MLILRCDYCGYEQKVKKRLDSETYGQLTANNGLYCDRRDCEGRNQKTLQGNIRIYGTFGGWTIVRPSTIEEYQGVKRAKALLKRMEDQK